jgi:hypothetical protein
MQLDADGFLLQWFVAKAKTNPIQRKDLMASVDEQWNDLIVQ